MYDNSFMADPSECPGSSCTAERGIYGVYEHAHCALDGCVLMAEAGGYTEATRCGNCKVLLGIKCARYGNDPKKPLCLDCDNAEIVAASNEALPILNLQYALQEVQESHARLNGESNQLKIDQMKRLVSQIRVAVDDYDKALTARRDRIFYDSMPQLPLTAA